MPTARSYYTPGTSNTDVQGMPANPNPLEMMHALMGQEREYLPRLAEWQRENLGRNQNQRPTQRLGQAPQRVRMIQPRTGGREREDPYSDLARRMALGNQLAAQTYILPQRPLTQGPGLWGVGSQMDIDWSMVPAALRLQYEGPMADARLRRAQALRTSLEQGGAPPGIQGGAFGGLTSQQIMEALSRR